MWKHCTDESKEKRQWVGLFPDVVPGKTYYYQVVYNCKYIGYHQPVLGEVSDCNNHFDLFTASSFTIYIE